MENAAHLCEILSVLKWIHANVVGVYICFFVVLIKQLQPQELYLDPFLHFFDATKITTCVKYFEKKTN